MTENQISRNEVDIQRILAGQVKILKFNKFSAIMEALTALNKCKNTFLPRKSMAFIFSTFKSYMKK